MSKGEQNAGREQFISVLPSTLEALCNMQAAPHDDTILHHLLDAIRELILSQDDALRSGLLDFLDTVREKADSLSSAVLVLALGVAAHLVPVTSKSGTLCQRLTSLYDVIQSSVVSGNSSVGAAYFNSLCKVAACPMGLRWLECNTVHFQTALSTLETAQSVFLLNAAENFITTVLNNSLETDGPTSTHSPPSSSIVVDGIKRLTSELMEMKKTRATLLDQMVVSSHVCTFHESLVKTVCALTHSKAFCEWKAEDESFVSVLAHLALRHSSEKIQSSALQSIVSLVEFMSENTREEFLKNEIVSPLLKLTCEGGVEKSTLVAAAFVKASKNIEASEALKSLQKLVQLPHDLLFGQQVACAELASLVSAITTALCDRQRFSRLTSTLLHCIKQTGNSEGLVRLVVGAGTTRDDDDWVSVLSSWPQGVGVVVVNNHKLLNFLLDLFQQDCCFDLTMDQCAELLMCLMHIMRRPLVESRMYSQTSTAFVNILSKQYKNLCPGEIAGMEKVLTHWTELMEYRLQTLQWEIRDTTLEHVRHVLAIVSDGWFHSTVTEHHLLRLAWGCTKYGDSYPRASAIALATSLATSPLWGAFLQDADITEDTLADEMVDVLAKDPEAFPRHAAVLFLTALVSRSVQPPHSAACPPDTTMQNNKICAAMTSAMNDFDWDVKLKVLDFWEKLAAPLFLCEDNTGSQNTGEVTGKNQAVMSDSKLHRKRPAPKQHNTVSSKEYHDTLETLLRKGFGKALLIGAEDYDSTVKQKALRMLASFQQQADSEKNLPAKAQRLHGESDATNLHSIKMEGEEPSNGELTASSDRSVVSVDQFLQAVSQLDPVTVLQQQNWSTDEYDKKPTSLLEDVMAAVKQASVVNEVTLMSEDEFEDADDMFVDCY